MASIALLSGGFGGARFAAPLLTVAGASEVAVITNPGDDLRYLGMEVWPDFDSVLYAAAGVFDEALGWGISGDTLRCADALGPSGWFRMGDRDIALSLRRTGWLEDGLDRGAVARRCCEAMGVEATLVPAAAEPHRTQVRTRHGWEQLQHYLVRRRAADAPKAVRLRPRAAAGTPEALAALDADTVLLAPSNPVASIAPILATPGVLERVLAAPRVIAVSPVVSARAPRLAPERSRFAVRGRMLEMLGLPHDPAGVAAFYDGLVDAWVVDVSDEPHARAIERELGLPVLRTDLLRAPGAPRARLAEEVLAFARRQAAVAAPRAVRSRALNTLVRMRT